MADGFWKPKYRDRHGKIKSSPFWWFRDPVDRKRKSTGFRDKEAAKAYRAERERLRASPAHYASHQATPSKWGQRMLEVKRARRAEGTAKMYRSKLGHLYRIIGADTSMASITPTVVDRYVETRTSEGAVNSTIGKELTTLSQVCKLAKRGGEYPEDVRALRPVGFSVEYKPRKRVASKAELDLLRLRLEPSEWGMVAFIVATSARLSEALRFQPGDYDQTRKVVTIHGTKTQKAHREVPILDPFQKLFSEALAQAPYTWVRISKHLPEKCSEFEIPPLTPNDLRRTTATMLRAAGCTPDAIAMVMGHVNSRMVEQVYGRLSAEELRLVIEAQLKAGPGLRLSKTGRKRQASKPRNKNETR